MRWSLIWRSGDTNPRLTKLLGVLTAMAAEEGWLSFDRDGSGPSAPARYPGAPSRYLSATTRRSILPDGSRGSSSSNETARGAL